MGMGSTRVSGGPGSEQDVTLDDVDCQKTVGPEAATRAISLLAHWALRRGRMKGILPAGSSANRVTGDGIKGYGANDGSN
jgi:hypothetical protein